MSRSNLEGIPRVLIPLELTDQAVAIFAVENSANRRELRIFGQPLPTDLKESRTQARVGTMIMMTSEASQSGRTNANAWLSAPPFLCTLSTLSIAS